MSSISRNSRRFIGTLLVLAGLLGSSRLSSANPSAFSQADAALKLQPDNASVHYLRGRILQHLRRTDQAKAEMHYASAISNQARAKRQKELHNPDPDLQQALEP